MHTTGLKIQCVGVPDEMGIEMSIEMGIEMGIEILLFPGRSFNKIFL